MQGFAGNLFEFFLTFYPYVWGTYNQFFNFPSLVIQGTVLDGHALILQLCHTKKDGQLPKKTENDKSSTKLLVRNVAFEATEKDLRQLFSPFGQVIPLTVGILW